MPRDLNLLASKIADMATNELLQQEPEQQKNPHAVAGRLGGLKGGKARAEVLTAEERSAIARKAVRARWAKKN